MGSVCLCPPNRDDGVMMMFTGIKMTPIRGGPGVGRATPSSTRRLCGTPGTSGCEVFSLWCNEDVFVRSMTLCRPQEGEDLSPDSWCSIVEGTPLEAPWLQVARVFRPCSHTWGFCVAVEEASAPAPVLTRARASLQQTYTPHGISPLTGGFLSFFLASGVSRVSPTMCRFGR